MKKNSIQLLTMITGIFTALVIVFSQFFFLQHSDGSKKLVKTEKQEKQKNGDEKNTFITAPSISQPSSSHTEIQPKSSLYLFDITFEEVSTERYLTDIPLSFGKFFQTLFRVFITPNAP